LAWGTKEYEPDWHIDKPTVFFGLYDVRDYYALWRHRGKKWILWAGSDLENLKQGFAFNNGRLRWLSILFRGLLTRVIVGILRDVEHWVENHDEHDKLLAFGIESQICPSFLGDIKNFPISYKHNKRPNVYVSGHPDRESEYGFEEVQRIAKLVPECTFHLYGADWHPESQNIVCHGRVSREQFNDEIKEFQCGLRLNLSDGFSEITCKSALMGQYPIARLYSPEISHARTDEELVTHLKQLVYAYHPNHNASRYYNRILNKYPWNMKQHD
jgi:hypothetical protein